MSALKSKSSIALIVVIIIVLLLIPAWYTTIGPVLIASQLEKIETTKYLNGTLNQFGSAPMQILMEQHIHTDGVKGDNVILKVEVITKRTDTNETLTDFSQNLTYVFNKFTRKTFRTHLTNTLM